MEGLKLPKLVAFIFSYKAIADKHRDIKETGQELLERDYETNQEALLFWVIKKSLRAIKGNKKKTKINTFIKVKE